MNCDVFGWSFCEIQTPPSLTRSIRQILFKICLLYVICAGSNTITLTTIDQSYVSQMTYFQRRERESAWHNDRQIFVYYLSLIINTTTPPTTINTSRTTTIIIMTTCPAEKKASLPHSLSFSLIIWYFATGIPLKRCD